MDVNRTKRAAVVLGTFVKARSKQAGGSVTGDRARREGNASKKSKPTLMGDGSGGGDGGGCPSHSRKIGHTIRRYHISQNLPAEF